MVKRNSPRLPNRSSVVTDSPSDRGVGCPPTSQQSLTAQCCCCSKSHGDEHLGKRRHRCRQVSVEKVSVGQCQRSGNGGGASSCTVLREARFRNAGIGLVTSFDAFRAEVGRQGFDRIGDVYQTFRACHADFSVDEASLMSWSDDLLNRECVGQAVALLQFNVQLHPQSTNAHTALA